MQSQLFVATEGPRFESHSRQENLYGRNLHSLNLLQPSMYSVLLPFNQTHEWLKGNQSFVTDVSQVAAKSMFEP